MRRLLITPTIAAVIAACSATGGGSDAGNDSDSRDDLSGISDLDDDESISLDDGSGGGDGTPRDDDGEPTTIDGTITDDQGGVLNLAGTPQVVNFGLTLADGTATTGLLWSLDDTRIGSITTDGVFTAKGMVGGIVKVTASLGNSSLTRDFEVNVELSRNTGNLDMAAQTTLMTAAGQSDPTFQFLYPYTGTVFPRGVEPPLLQLKGPGTDKAMVEITSEHFHYVQYANSKVSTHFQVELPADIWDALALSALGSEEVGVAVTKSSGGTATERWIFAPASIKGIIYYSTYNSQKNAGNPAIMRVRPGATAEVLQTGCTACHSVSANGGVLAAGKNGFPASGESGLDQWNPEDSFTVNLDPQGAATPRYTAPDGRKLVFAGLTPDGSMALTNGVPPLAQDSNQDPLDGIPPFMPHGTQSVNGLASQLISTTTGQPLASPTLGAIVTYAIAPTFSPDATRVAFINGDIRGAKTIWTADFDAAANPPVFSNGKQAISSTSILAWPSFLPDTQGLVFSEGDSFDSAGFQGDFAPVEKLYGEIRLAELGTGEVKDLNALNGRDPAGISYLPHGESEENRMNYEASVLPVAVGGYYWVLFTSRRTYGNEIAPSGVLANGEVAFGNWGPSAGTPRKKLWIAALDVNHGVPDPSHPAFYLSGQERTSGNMRAFAALEPCRADSATCESGSDCCGGFCRETSRDADGTPVLQCVAPPAGECSNIDELCFTASNCCDAEASCVNKRCTFSTPVVVR